MLFFCKHDIINKYRNKFPEKEVYTLANEKKKMDSAKKRVITSKAKNLRNRMIRSAYKTLVKKYEVAVAGGDKATATSLYSLVMKKTDQAAAKGVLHPNNAARKKSRFTLMLNAMA